MNWKFVDEQTFLSKEFALALVLLNVALLALFISSRWLEPSGLYLTGFIKALARPSSPSVQQRISLRVDPSFVMTTILSSMVVGLLCARSLHYQFYSYISWSTPFLLWRSGFHPVLIYVVWAVQEWAWNIYPSTALSSIVVFGCLLLQVLAIWWGTTSNLIGDSPSFKKSDKKNYHAN